MKRILYIFAIALAAAACAKDDGMLPADEIGVLDEAPTVGCAAGEYILSVLSDGPFTVQLDNASWISFTGKTERVAAGEGDSEIRLSCEFNRGLMRQTTLTLVRGRKTLPVVLTQLGVLSSDISFPDNSMTIDGEGGSESARVLSVYKDEDLDISVSYDGAAGWISDVYKSNNFIHFNALANGSGENRTARISVVSRKYPEIGDVMQVLQLGGEAPQWVTFSEVRNLLPVAGEMTVEENWCIDGIVIGDNSEGNGGENINISANLQDLTCCARTLYLQDAAGEYGFRILLNRTEDNLASRYSHVRLLLKGAKLECKGGDEVAPLHYDISGIGSEHLMSCSEGSRYDIPAKEKYIDELTDADVYTFVTLRDCEIPIRKGPFVPIDIRHRHVIHSYPMVIRDKRGGTAHLYTNHIATWQRDGNGLPQGAGSISGVIVHETCDNFDWDEMEMDRRIDEGVLPDYITGIGHIGRYQIRPFTRKEIALADKFEDGFSEMLMEIRYYNASNTQIVKNVADKTIYSTYPPVPDPINSTEIKGYLQLIQSNGSTGTVDVWRDWTHVGPEVNGEITDGPRGNGVFDYYGVPAEWEPYSSVRTTSLIMKSSAWYKGANWSVNQYWQATVNTEGLTYANFPLSVQFGCVSGLGQTVGAPRYWRLEYSLNKIDWVEMDDYTVPDFPILSNRMPWQCPGPKYVSITLPEDTSLLGQSEVYIRLRPTSNVAGTIGTYSGGEIVSGRETELNYFAVRYNK